MKKFFFLFFVIKQVLLFGQKESDILPYVEKYKEIAIREMELYKIPASITLAQGVHESNAGKSELAINARNHFGIKCKADWTGGRYSYDDDAKGECFRVYDNAEESYKDHSVFLSTRDRYKNLFSLDIKDYKGWAFGLKAAGYATNPKYPQILISIIEKFELYKYDQPTNSLSTAVLAERVSGEKPIIEESKNKELKPSNSSTARMRRTTFDFHNIRAIVAESDESPEMVAKEFNIDLALLLQYNDLKPGDSFRKGEFIFLQPKWNYGAKPEHVVKSDETMWIISQRYGIKLKTLYELNLINEGEQPEPNTLISLKDKREKPVPVIPISKMYYEVQPKETLYSIAKSLNISVEELMQWNNLTTKDIKVGQRLVLR